MNDDQQNVTSWEELGQLLLRDWPSWRRCSEPLADHARFQKAKGPARKAAPSRSRKRHRPGPRAKRAA